MNGRLLLALVLLASPLAGAADAPLRSLAVLEFELIDDTQDAASRPAQEARLGQINGQLRRELAERRLYRVVDNAPAADLIGRYRAAQSLYACNGCELDIARKLGAERVMTGWVQKVSNLILNINVEVKDAATGETTLKKSVDIRGNTDESWRRGVSCLVRDMAEKGQGGR